MNKLREAVAEATAGSSDEAVTELFRIIERFTEECRNTRPLSPYRFSGTETADLVKTVFGKAEIEFSLDESKTSPGVFTLRISRESRDKLVKLAGSGSEWGFRTALVILGRKDEALARFPDGGGWREPERGAEPPAGPVIEQELVEKMFNTANDILASGLLSGSRFLSLAEIEAALRKKGIPEFGLFKRELMDPCGGATAGRYARLGDGVINAAPVLAAPMSFISLPLDNFGDGANPLRGYLDFSYVRYADPKWENRSAVRQYRCMEEQGFLPSALLIYGNEVIHRTPEALSIIADKEKTLQYIRYLYAELAKLAGLNLNVAVNGHTRIGVSEFNPVFHRNYDDLDGTYSILEHFDLTRGFEDGEGNCIEFYDDRESCGEQLSGNPDTNAFSVLYYGVALTPASEPVPVTLPEPMPTVMETAKKSKLDRIVNSDLAAEWFLIAHPDVSGEVSSAKDVHDWADSARKDRLLQAVDTDPGTGLVASGIRTALRLIELDSGIKTGVEKTELKIYSGISQDADGDERFPNNGAGGTRMFPGKPTLRSLSSLINDIRSYPESMVFTPERKASYIPRAAWLLVETNIPFNWYPSLANSNDDRGAGFEIKLRNYLTVAVFGSIVMGYSVPEFFVKFVTGELPDDPRTTLRDLKDCISAAENGSVTADNVDKAVGKMISGAEDAYLAIQRIFQYPGDCDYHTCVYKLDNGNIGFSVLLNANMLLAARYRFRLARGIPPLSKHASGVEPRMMWVLDGKLHMNSDCGHRCGLYPDMFSQAVTGLLLDAGGAFSRDSGFNEARYRGWFSPLFQPFCYDMDNDITCGPFTSAWYTTAGTVSYIPPAGGGEPELIVPDFR